MMKSEISEFGHCAQSNIKPYGGCRWRRLNTINRWRAAPLRCLMLHTTKSHIQTVAEAHLDTGSGGWYLSGCTVAPAHLGGFLEATCPGGAQACWGPAVLIWKQIWVNRCVRACVCVFTVSTQIMTSSIRGSWCQLLRSFLKIAEAGSWLEDSCCPPATCLHHRIFDISYVMATAAQADLVTHGATYERNTHRFLIVQPTWWQRGGSRTRAFLLSYVKLQENEMDEAAPVSTETCLHPDQTVTPQGGYVLWAVRVRNSTQTSEAANRNLYTLGWQTVFPWGRTIGPNYHHQHLCSVHLLIITFKKYKEIYYIIIY